MDCKDFVEIVTDYMENTMQADERARLEFHLTECDGCTEYLAQMYSVTKLISTCESEAVSSETHAKLMDVFHTWRDVA